MPKPKNKKDVKKDKNVKIKKSGSSLVEFIQRPVPSEEEVDNFDEFIHNEIKEEEIDESLSEIYQDEKGNAVNISKLDIKKRRGVFFWLFSFVFILLIAAGAGYASYYYLYLRGTGLSDPMSVQLAVSAPNEVIAGEEFFYAVDYKNLGSTEADINNIEIKLVYPDNFIFLDSQPQPRKGNNIWQFQNLPPNSGGQIKIKGMLIGEQDYVGVLLADMRYTPANFSSEFKKEATKEVIISNTGLDIEVESDSSVLVNEEREIVVHYQAAENNYLNNFRLTFVQPENMEILSQPDNQPGKNVWMVNNVGSEDELKIKFKIKEKINETEKMSLLFEHSEDGENYYKFQEESIVLEIINSDLNLTLIINGSRNDQSVDFGETMNYSIVYANKGETEMKDVIIMAIIESDFLDWNSLDIKNGGQAKEGIIVWNKEEIPILEALQPGSEGTVDFSINVLPMEKIDLAGKTKKYQIKSYAQFSVSGLTDDSDETFDGAVNKKTDIAEGDTYSNTIINTINSDLKLIEQIRYFNEDNIPVGSGPLPPKVGETTTYKVYWTISNNLHELNDLRIEAELPTYVSWDAKNRTTVGSLKYDSGEHKVIWEAGRLPISVEKITAEFSIGITPVPADRNKIMVLLPGTNVKAVDKETGSEINVATKAKTTKLEDDDIADDDGVVE